MRVKLDAVGEDNWEAIRYAIGAGAHTPAIGGVGVLYAADKVFRDALQEAAKRRGVDKDGRLTK